MRVISSRRQQVRRTTSTVMLGLTGFFALLVVAPLLWILTYVVQQGLPALSWQFFTQLPTPVGVPGGGIVNALVGSAMTVGLGLLIAAPIGILVGVYAALSPNTVLGT